MAKAKKSKTLAPKLVDEFKFSTSIRVLRPQFKPLAALKSLDVKRLKTGEHRIEVGFLHGGCCPKLVEAVIRNGKVIALEVAPCEGSERVESNEVKRLVRKVRARMKAPRKWTPIPVEQLVPRMLARQAKWGTGEGCFYICAFSWCLFCCWWNWPFFCWIETRAPSTDSI